MSSNTPTVRIARWSATHPWRALGLWFGFVAVAVTMMSMVPTHGVSDADDRTGQSGRADEMLVAAGLDEAPQESVLITSRDDGGLEAGRAIEAASRVRADASDIAGVASVGQPVTAPEGDAVLVPVTLDEDADEDAQAATATAIGRVAEAVAGDFPDVRVGQAGDASIGTAIDQRVGEDLGRGEAMSLPVTFLIMVVAFGAVIAAGIPVLLAFTSVLATLGLYAPLSYLVPDAGTVANVVLLIGMAVGVDYTLFVLKREREERLRGRNTLDAIEVAAATSGRAVVVSGLAVIVSMSGLFLARDVVFAGLALGSILVVAVAILGSLTVLPALLAKLGHWVDRPRVPLLWRLNRRIGAGGISGRLISPVIARPRTAAAVSGLLLVALALPAAGMNLQQGSLRSLPDDLGPVRTAQQIEQHFPAENPAVAVVADTGSLGVAGTRTALSEVGTESAHAGLTAAPTRDSIALSGDGSTMVLTVPTTHPEGDRANDAAVESLRTDILPSAFAEVPDDTWAVGGGVAADLDYRDSQVDALPWVIGFVLLLTLTMMLLTFRSLTLALLTTVLNLLSVGAAFGVMTLVFQGTWAESLLDFRSTGAVIDWVPLFCFVVLVGLSMDYHVFVLSRVREGLRNGLPHWLAVERGVRDTAGVVTSAAAVMVSVFATFALLSMVEMKQMGVGLAVAILVDATLVRLVLLPSLLLIFERRLSGLGGGSTRAVDEAVRAEPQPV